MGRFISMVCFLAFIVMFSSCATTNAAKENEVVGYNLKSKKEQMQQKILHSKNKTLIACQ